MQVEAEVKLTPEIMANAFWNMESKEQCQFFEKLYDAVRADYEYGLCEYQWFRMNEELEKNPKAKEMACAVMASVFLHATNFLDSRT